MRKTIIACLLFLTTGCIPLTQPEQIQTDTQVESFHNALVQLVEKSDSGSLKSFIQKHPETVLANNAKRILQLHNNKESARNKLKDCTEQLDLSKLEIEKLQADIERLTQLHLKMGRNDP